MMAPAALGVLLVLLLRVNGLNETTSKGENNQLVEPEEDEPLLATVSTTSQQQGAVLDSLNELLEQLKGEIVTRVQQITTEKKWIHQVFEQIQTYEEKVMGVVKNLKYLQSEVKTLLSRKKAVENKILQEKLNQRLILARGDLDKLDKALGNVHDKKSTFQETKEYIEKNIKSIESQLKALGPTSNDTSISIPDADD